MRQNQYPIIELGSVTSKIGSGATPRGGKSAYIDSGIPLIRSMNVYDFVFDYSDLAYLNVNQAQKLKNVKVQSRDVLLNITGASVGRCCIVPEGLVPARVNQHVSIIRPLPNIVDSYYMLYTLNSKSYKDALLNVSTNGATREALTKDDICRFAIPLPPLPTQRKIAAILSAYDELIENNRRRIALLERMAEEVYREWFVRLRFPGHEEVKVVKGVPEGWEVMKVDDAFKFTGGGTPSKKISRYWNGGEVNWYTPSDITAAQGIFLSESSDQCTDEGFSSSSAKMFPAYSVMMTSRATIGAIGINRTEACTNQGFITCIPNERLPLPFLYHWLKLGKSHFEMLSSGATFAELTKGTFKKIGVTIPPSPVMEKFVQVQGPIFDMIEACLAENENLTKTRDLLLPRLISGKLSVEDLDIVFPPGMAEEGMEAESTTQQELALETA